jgi:hypothetical protein
MIKPKFPYILPEYLLFNFLVLHFLICEKDIITRQEKIGRKGTIMQKSYRAGTTLGLYTFCQTFTIVLV